MISVRYTTTLSALLLIALCPSSIRSQTKPDKDYLVYVVSESADKLALIRFGPGGARIDRQIDTGDMPVDIDGPHGIVMKRNRPTMTNWAAISYRLARSSRSLFITSRP